MDIRSWHTHTHKPSHTPIFTSYPIFSVRAVGLKWSWALRVLSQMECTPSSQLIPAFLLFPGLSIPPTHTVVTLILSSNW